MWTYFNRHKNHETYIGVVPIEHYTLAKECWIPSIVSVTNKIQLRKFVIFFILRFSKLTQLLKIM